MKRAFPLWDYWFGSVTHLFSVRSQTLTVAISSAIRATKLVSGESQRQLRKLNPDVVDILVGRASQFHRGRDVGDHIVAKHVIHSGRDNLNSHVEAGDQVVLNEVASRALWVIRRRVVAKPEYPIGVGGYRVTVDPIAPTLATADEDTQSYVVDDVGGVILNV